MRSCIVADGGCQRDGEEKGRTTRRGEEGKKSWGRSGVLWPTAELTTNNEVVVVG